MQIYPRSCLDQQNRHARCSESSQSNAETTKPRLFQVHSDGSPPTSNSEWFDVETEKHDKTNLQ